MTNFDEIWGSGNGIVKKLTPQTRIICCVLLLITLLILPSSSTAGIISGILIVLSWNLLCGSPVKIYEILLPPSAIALVPFIILSTMSGFAVTGSILFHSLASLFICIGGFTSLTMNDFHEGISLMPLSGSVSALIIQIVHQTLLLVSETQMIMMSMRLRMAGSRNLDKCGVMFNFPVVWLERLVHKAGSISDAMVLRNYGTVFPASEHRKFFCMDWCFLITEMSLIVFAIAVRRSAFL